MDSVTTFWTILTMYLVGAAALITDKIIGRIALSWWLVTAPLWIPALILLIIASFLGNVYRAAEKYQREYNDDWVYP